MDDVPFVLILILSPLDDVGEAMPRDVSLLIVPDAAWSPPPAGSQLKLGMLP